MGVSIKEIEQLNDLAKKYNLARQQAIGKKQSAVEAYERALKAYEAKYGVVLTDTLLQQEYTTVYSESVKGYNNVQAIVKDIESGNYANVEDKFSIDTEALDESIVNAKDISIESIPQVVIKEPSIEEVKSQFISENEQEVATTVHASVPDGGIDFMDMIANLNLDTNNDVAKEDISETPFQPTGWGIADKTDINANFEGILQKSEV